MENNKKICQACKGYLFDDDDVVVCPVCGAPHHRDCYDAVGHCGVESAHGTPNQYDLLLKRQQEKKKSEGDKIICPRCGKLCTTEENFCHNCSYPLKQQQSGYGYKPFGGMPFGGAAISQHDLYGGVSPKTQIEDDVTAEDVKDFVAINTSRYIPKFLSLRGQNDKRKKGVKREGALPKKPIVSWNWAAFLLPANWMFYRKMYFQGVGVLLLQIATAMCSYPFTDFIYENIPDTATTTQAMSDYVILNFDKASLPILLFFIGTLVSIVIRVLCGMFGDSMYKSHCMNRIREIKKSDETEELKAELTKKGGVSIWLFLLSYFVSMWVPQILYAFL